MSEFPSRRLRLHALAAATAVALLTAPAVAADRVNLSGLQSAPTHDRFIVKYRDGNAATVQRALDRAAATALGRGSSLGLQRLRSIATGAVVVRASRRLDRGAAETLMRQIAADPNVEYVEVDQLLQPALTPNDPGFGDQYGFGTGAGGMRATQAWDSATGSGIVVAVIDTGITDHSDLNANILPGYDFISDTFVSRDGDGRDSDASDPGDWNNDASRCRVSNSSWHGTHVAGTVAAVTNNNKGVAGTAFNARVVPIRALGRCGGYTSDIADGIIWASGGSVGGVPANQNPAEVVNLSLGGGGACSSTTQSAINGAVSRGTTVVVAAGNSNANVSNFTPANCNNVVAVASTTSTGARSSFSNYGSLIDVAAPGSGILSTLNNGSTTPGSESYASYSGTSMAAPHTAGVVALMQSIADSPLTPAEVESLLKSTARDFPSTPSQPIGAGIVNAKAAVDAVDGGGGGDPPGDNELENGVAVTGISGGSGSQQFWTLEVPAGASNLSFQISGGSGDADLYVNFGSAPTTGSYDCRPYRNGNNETCDFPSPQAGTWHVMLRGYSSFSGVSLVGEYDAGGGGGGAPCTGCTQYSGSLSGSGESDIQPDGNYYYSSRSGSYQGWLEGPSGTDFDLRLYRWNGGSWTQVANSLSSGSSESISYSGSAGYYYWRIESYSGSGSYDFWLKNP